MVGILLVCAISIARSLACHSVRAVDLHNAQGAERAESSSSVSAGDARLIQLTGTGLLAGRPVGGIALLCAVCRRHVVFLLYRELSL